jgi:hydroxyacylglutathione hydrolase
MILEQIMSDGLAQYSYLLGDRSSGQCLVVDPRRDVEIYLEIAKQNEMRIVNILETHIHADFVSGSLELAARTDAPISISAFGEVGFKHVPLGDGEVISLGALELKVIHTPGHTPEHICFLVSGGSGSEQPWALFSGDLLFAGEVGRPDLLGEEIEETLVHQLYDSLHNKVLKLGDDLVVYPGHGAGSPCGASIGDRSLTTIGYEKHNNPILQIKKEEEFIKAVRESLSPAPSYYKRVKKINTDGPVVFGSLPSINPLSAQEFRELAQEQGALIVDGREVTAYGGGHIKNAIHIGLRASFPIWAGEIIDETFPVWAGRMIDPEGKIGLVLPEEGRVDEAQLYLFRIGIDNIGGYLREGFRTWLEAGFPFVRTEQRSVHELNQQLQDGVELQILDVRRQAEWEIGHIPGAKQIYVPDILEKIDELDRTLPVVTYCGTGYRASIASSILEKEGFVVHNIPGSMSAWRQAGFPEESVSEG